jgi:undecaprenyl-diphosphatase
LKHKISWHTNRYLITLSLLVVCFSSIIMLWGKNINLIESKWVLMINQYHQASFDRIINFISDLATPLLIIIALLGLVRFKIAKQNTYRNFSIYLIIAFAMNAILSFIVKNIVCRERPFHVNEAITKLGSGGSFSFPSGHSADAILLGLVILYFFDTKSIRVFAICWMILIPLTRIYLGVHYFSDVLGSICISLISHNAVMQLKSGSLKKLFV